MKKFLSLELVILFLFFAMGNARCEDSFNVGAPINDGKNKITFPKSNDIQEAKPVEKKGIFSKIFKKKKKSNKETQGYYGSLPNIKQDFKYKEQTSSKSAPSDVIISPDKINDSDLKSAPTNDALFLDVIVKKEKSSNYINDVQKTKFALLNLKKCIEEQGDIQRFNGCVNMIDLYSKNLRQKYENQSDSLRDSYIDIQNTNYHAKVLGNLLYDANYYSRYTPTDTGKYSKNNIELEKEKLLKRINKTLFLIANET